MSERKLLDAAREGDEGAFRELVESHHKELHAHCYRMLGSAHDADDAVQEALLRAWRGLAKFEGRSSLRSWLYRIATNACLDVLARRQKRVLPVDYAPAAGTGDELGEPLTESVWIEPYADLETRLEDRYATPEARYEREAAEALDTTVASVNGALRRARKAAAERLPSQSQQATLRALGDERLQELTARYIAAWERADVDAIVAMLAEDATFSMPPLATWFRGREAIAAFISGFALQDRWRLLPARANGQLAFGCYAWDDERESYTALSLDVLTLSGAHATEVTSFVTPYTQGAARQRFAIDVFERFGLPVRLD